ncbi:InlB B-repeat-containing protein [Candidatus Saccharibacteria bacterium]|nr:InlB B-repeat-containing protein [Candidatus Saccharibacteria bacterium]
MRRKYFKLLYAAIPLVIAVIVAIGNTIAAGYNMPYSGGVNLENAVIEDADLVDSLTPLIEKGSGVDSTPYGGEWIEGVYMKPSGTTCRPAKAMTFSKNNATSLIGNSFKVQGASYEAYVTIEGVDVDISSSSSVAPSQQFALVINPNNNSINVGYRLFTDSSCTEAIPSFKHLDTTDGVTIYVNTKIALRKKNKTTNFTASGVHFGLTDIDAAQSYKILNSDNVLTANSNMYTRSKTSLQPTSGTLRNKFNNDYIYSQFSGEDLINLTGDDGHIYVPLTLSTQSSGLNMVFGYANAAGSGIEFYAQEFNVDYTSDSNGSITGITTEKVASGGQPSGSTQSANSGYEFSHWVANKDVTLANNSAVIPAGNHLTSDQVTQVVVKEDITFTAIHQATTPEPTQYTVTYTTDGHGTITGIPSETVNENSSPSGTSQTPNTNYSFICWKANAAVTLKSGSTIAQGACITSTDLTNVVVNRNLTFTANYEYNEPEPTYYTVTYTSDENGEITGITSETVESGNEPSGSAQEPNEGYKFIHWVANANVILNDGTPIAADSPITEAQLKKVIVTQNLQFTAIHEAIPNEDDPEDEPEEEPEEDTYPMATPDTGSSTGEINAVVLPVSILSVVSVFTIHGLIKIFRKRIAFKE